MVRRRLQKADVCEVNWLWLVTTRRMFRIAATERESRMANQRSYAMPVRFVTAAAVDG